MGNAIHCIAFTSCAVSTHHCWGSSSAYLHFQCVYQISRVS
jgi:hypothetical protein